MPQGPAAGGEPLSQPRDKARRRQWSCNSQVAPLSVGTVALASSISETGLPPRRVTGNLFTGQAGSLFDRIRTWDGLSVQAAGSGATSSPGNLGCAPHDLDRGMEASVDDQERRPNSPTNSSWTT